MDLNQKILAGLLAGFLLVALIRVFSVPLKLAQKLLDTQEKNVEKMKAFL